MGGDDEEEDHQEDIDVGDEEDSDTELQETGQPEETNVTEESEQEGDGNVDMEAVLLRATDVRVSQSL